MKPLLWIIVWTSALAASNAYAGISAENVIVVVNAESEISKTIANHYVQIRGIPNSNVISLSGVPSGLRVSLTQFKEKILQPLLAEIDERKLAAQTRVIAYSAGFPTAINIPEHAGRLTDAAQKKIQTPTASINSLTYFFRFVLADVHDYLSFNSNLYARAPFERNFTAPLGGELGERFQTAQTAWDEKRFADAARGWSSLAKEIPTLTGLNIRAGEAFIKDNQRAQAIQQLGLAIKNGWSNRRYLVTDSPLRTLFSERDLESVDRPSERTTLGRLLSETDDLPMKWQNAVGFATDVGWSLSGAPIPLDKGGVSYMLSCCLAVVDPLGSTRQQAIDHLTFTATGDRTFPAASVGFSKTSDVRSTTRLPVFADAIVGLLAMDRPTEIFSSILPTTKTQYVGLMIGTPEFQTSDRQWTLVPGSLADNLTSVGGAFDTNSQTKLTNLLHAGAAMSSGTVAEPYAIAMKFPSPMMHVFYAEGATAIEAFYLSTPSPYQLLIVGDPLAGAFVRPPIEQVSMELVPTDQSLPDAPREVRVTVERPSMVQADANRHSPTAMMDVFVLDRLVQRLRPMQTLNLRLPNQYFGTMNVRVTLVGKHATEPRSTFDQTFVFGDESLLPSIQASELTDQKAPLSVTLKCNGAERIELMHLSQVIATVEGTSGTVELSADQTGSGPLRLHAVGIQGDKQLVGPSVVVKRKD